MAEKRTTKTSPRLAERQRRRAEQERRSSLVRLIPFVILGLIGLVLVGLGLYGTLRSSGAIDDPNSKPQIAVDHEKLELGDQKLGSTVRAQFNIKNTGSGTLKLNVPAMPTVLEGC